MFSTEKSLSEHGAKISDALKKEIEEAIADAKKSKDSTDVEEVGTAGVLLFVKIYFACPSDIHPLMCPYAKHKRNHIPFRSRPRPRSCSRRR